MTDRSTIRAARDDLARIGAHGLPKVAARLSAALGQALEWATLGHGPGGQGGPSGSGVSNPTPSAALGADPVDGRVGELTAAIRQIRLGLDGARAVEAWLRPLAGVGATLCARCREIVQGTDDDPVHPGALCTPCHRHADAARKRRQRLDSVSVRPAS